MTKIILATFALAIAAPIADAKRHLTISDVVKRAHGNPWKCDLSRDNRYGWKQLHCVVRVVFKREPRAGREAARIISCESNWDRYNVTPPYSASGLAQFLPSTWRHTKYGKRDVFNPVWNVKGMRWLYLHDGRSWHEWVCARIVGV